jgi:hypothetical protein
MNWLSQKVSPHPSPAPSPAPSPSPSPAPATQTKQGAEHPAAIQVGKPLSLKSKRRKQKIPAAFREQIWFRDYGHTFEGKCPTKWCSNIINVFDFQSGHNIPESKGGPTIPDNLIPVCARCNMSMGDRFSFTEWSALNGPMATSRAIAPIVTPSKSGWCCV